MCANRINLDGRGAAAVEDERDGTEGRGQGLKIKQKADEKESKSNEKHGEQDCPSLYCSLDVFCFFFSLPVCT